MHALSKGFLKGTAIPNNAVMLTFAVLIVDASVGRSLPHRGLFHYAF
jgi:hypothetical protein